MYGRLQQRTPYFAALDAVSLHIFVTLLSCVLPAAILLLIAACQRINQRVGLMALNGLIGASAMVTVLGIFSHRSFDGGLRLVDSAWKHRVWLSHRQSLPSMVLAEVDDDRGGVCLVAGPLIVDSGLQ